LAKPGNGRIDYFEESVERKHESVPQKVTKHKHALLHVFWQATFSTNLPKPTEIIENSNFTHGHISPESNQLISYCSLMFLF
jgi:hypothetical protein